MLLNPPKDTNNPPISTNIFFLKLLLTNTIKEKSNIIEEKTNSPKDM